jgi:hypothetical protein
VRAFVCANGASRWFRADAPGQPASETRPFHLVRCEGPSGVIRSVWAWSSRVDAVTFAGECVEVALGVERHVHRKAETHWRMERTVDGVQSGIELAGWVAVPPSGPRNASVGARQMEPLIARQPIRLRRSKPVAFDLGEANYRRSEESWDEAGRPSAHVTVSASGDGLIVDVSVSAGEIVFVPASATNPYDNEHPDINGHGVQLYVHTPANGGAWMIVPEAGSPTARIRPLAGWGTLAIQSATWSRSDDGFSICVCIALPPLPRRHARGAYPLWMDVLVNETVPGRDRRRGQLVLSGAPGEFVYLRGDRHDASRLVPLMIDD